MHKGRSISRVNTDKCPNKMIAKLFIFTSNEMRLSSNASGWARYMHTHIINEKTNDKHVIINQVNSIRCVRVENSRATEMKCKRIFSYSTEKKSIGYGRGWTRPNDITSNAYGCNNHHDYPVAWINATSSQCVILFMDGFFYDCFVPGLSSVWSKKSSLICSGYYK